MMQIKPRFIGWEDFRILGGEVITVYGTGLQSALRNIAPLVLAMHACDMICSYLLLKTRHLYSKKNL